MDKRLYVVKKEAYRVESASLFNELKTRLGLEKLNGLLVYNIYDIFEASETDLEILKENVIAEKVTDEILEEVNLDGAYIAYESLPGQYDQRRDAAEQCMMIHGSKSKLTIKTGRLVVFDGELSNTDLEKIKKYMINPVENREKDLSVMDDAENVEPELVPVVHGFRALNEEDLKAFRKANGFAMNDMDILHIQKYFKDEEDRDPTETELKVLDTYWSDHCRHTTFETALKNIEFKDGKFKKEIEEAFEKYLALRKANNRDEKNINLMDMATIVAREFRRNGKLSDQEITDEINACSVKIEVDEDGEKKPWLLMFKNETHNHPTEIEPFGGASTCLGGAIRDPLSGRSFVYQALRVTGAGDITKAVEETLANKLPQVVISKSAADGYSSYGNQIGLASTYVREYYHPGFVAKRMELGAVVAAAPFENVVREKPKNTDVILLLGGDTGRDGIGGATGSSVEHDSQSIVKSSSEVQKGNAPVERKLQRLFRNPEFSRLIKKSNDFGAGGVSVAIGELAPSLNIDLDKVPVKYLGLSGTELAISESQERMAVVIDKKDVEKAKELAFEENTNAVEVATVTDTGRLVINYRGQKVVDLSRAFIDTNGVLLSQKVLVEAKENTDNPFKSNYKVTKDDLLSNLRRLNTTIQKGMVEKFDASVGRSTVLWPYGGKYQLTESDVSVQKLPTFGFTNTASAMAVGYNPYIASYSPYLGASYSVVEALARLVSIGCTYKGARLTNQEYFEKLGNDEKRWGRPFEGLLGLLKASLAFETPSIGGKDSMSGSFNDLDVPPTVATFAINTVDSRKVISPEFKKVGSNIYLVDVEAKENYEPDYENIKKSFDQVLDGIYSGKIISASVVKFGGIQEAVSKMAFGNKLGVEINTDEDIFSIRPGSMVVEVEGEIDLGYFKKLGKVTGDDKLTFNEISIEIDEAVKAATELFEKIYPIYIEEDLGKVESKTFETTEAIKAEVKVSKPRVIIPVFPGTNSEYDTKKAFEKAGAEVEVYVLNNLSTESLLSSMKKLADKIRKAQILAIVGGFSMGDEPDGSGKFIVNVLKNENVREAIEDLRARDGLILGICNGFQALIKSGLLPYANMDLVKEDSPTLFRNNINRHVSKIIRTKIVSNKSPWLSSFKPGDTHSIIISHGEGRLMVTKEEAERLFANGQVATQYIDFDDDATMNGVFNANSSMYAIEGLLSEDGRIFGKMGHSERYEEGLLKNIEGEKLQDIFKNAVEYFS